MQLDHIFEWVDSNKQLGEGGVAEDKVRTLLTSRRMHWTVEVVADPRMEMGKEGWLQWDVCQSAAAVKRVCCADCSGEGDMEKEKRKRKR